MARTWTAYDVADRLEQAAQAFRRLPSTHIAQPRSSLPDIVRDFNDVYACNETGIEPAALTARTVAEMDEVGNWLLWLERDEVELVWARANGIRWKTIAFHTGWGITKLKTEWNSGYFEADRQLGRERAVQLLLAFRADNADPKLPAPRIFVH